MEQTLNERCALFIQNRDTVRSAFRFQSIYIYPLCAALFTGRGKAADPDALRDAVTLLKANVGAFSNFRGLSKYPIASLLALDPDPAARMEHSLIVYDLLKEDFFSSAYLPVAAVTLSGVADPGDYAAVAGRTRALYLKMRQAHPFLTSSEDAVYATVLALSDKTDEQLLDAMEQCYRLLKPRFFSGNAVQALSAVLALSARPPEETCAAALALYNALSAAGMRFGSGYELPTLGTLVLSGKEPAVLIADMAEVNTFLSRQRGFGAMSIGKRQRLMYAALLLLPASDNALFRDASAISGTIALIIAQQAAICAAVAASAAASSSN